MLTIHTRIFLTILLFSAAIAGCGSSDDSDTDTAESPAITRSVDAAVFNGNEGCLDTNLDPNAAIYVIEGKLTNVGDLSAQDVTPVAVVQVVKTQDGNYQHSVEFMQAGDYTTLLTCNPEAAPGQITFIQKGVEHFIVNIDKSGNLDTSKKNDTHLNTSDQCSGCHALGETYVVSTVDHDYVRGVCLDCHLPVDQAGISVNVDVNRKPIVDVCNTTDSLNAAKVYVVEGDMTSLDSITVADIKPILMTPLINEEGNYRFVAAFVSSGDYTALLSCSLETEPSKITFVRRYHFFVKFQDMSSVDITQLPEMHLITTDACDSCHAFGAGYMVSSVNHDAIEVACNECHTSPPSGQAGLVITQIIYP